jgi:peptide/nickel transport system permease protein
MSQQREASLPSQEGQAIAGLRARRSLWGQVLLFFRKKPLGAVGATMALFIVIVAIFAPAIQTRAINLTDHTQLYATPSSEMLLGGDHLGRDMFSRLVAGSRISIRVGLISALLGCTIGLIVGVSSAYFGGIYDLVLQRVIDSVIAFPGLVLALALMAALGSSINNVIIALSISFMPTTVRLIRSQALAVKEMDYVLAAHAVGAHSLRIIFRHMIPNVLAIWIVAFTFLMGTAIIAEASLSFLGLGVGPDVPSWGGMLRGATKNYVGIGPWLPVVPGLAIFIVVFSWNVLGDSLRDVLDPRLRGTQ